MIAFKTLLLTATVAVSSAKRANRDNDVDPASRDIDVVYNGTRPQYTLVQNEEYQALSQQRRALYEKYNSLITHEPMSEVNASYRRKDNDGNVLERCCCPYEKYPESLRRDGDEIFPKCRYLYAYTGIYYISHSDTFFHLRQSSNPLRWNEWVCPGSVDSDIGSVSIKHSEDPADLAECERGNMELMAAQAAHEEKMATLKQDINEVDEKIDDMMQQWGCKMVTGVKVDGQYCGGSSLTNSDTCAKRKRRKGRKCYSTACYECKTTGKLFTRRKDGYLIKGHVSVERERAWHVSTSEAVHMDALESCRAACAVP